MINIRHAEYAFIILILALFACGCGQDMPVSDRSLAPVAIELRFAPNAAMQENITDIEITVSDPDSKEILKPNWCKLVIQAVKNNS